MRTQTLPYQRSVSTVTRRRTNAPVALIADDDPVLAMLLSDYLRSKGYATLIAGDAMQTVMYATRSEPSIVLLDINMPGGTGLKALRSLRANQKTATLPVIAISGTHNLDTQKELFDLGVGLYLSKPIDLEALYVRIRATLETATH